MKYFTFLLVFFAQFLYFTRHVESTGIILPLKLKITAFQPRLHVLSLNEALMKCDTFSIEPQANAAHRHGFKLIEINKEPIQIEIDNTRHCTISLFSPAFNSNPHKLSITKILNALENMTGVGFDLPDTKDLTRDSDSLGVTVFKEFYLKSKGNTRRRSSRSRGKRNQRSCRRACKEALRCTCRVYNCNKIRSSFKNKCCQNCKRVF